MKKFFTHMVITGLLVACSLPASSSAFDGNTVFMDSLYGGLTGVILSAVATAQSNKDDTTDPVARESAYFIGGLAIGAVVGVIHASAKESRLAEWRRGNIRLGLLDVAVVRDARGHSEPMLQILSGKF